MLRIGDIVEQSSRGADVGDVQIGWYPNDPQNAKLAEQFLFTGTAETGKVSSLDILKKIRDTFLYPRDNENRLTVIATYGHGKTHLALALANFFGKPSDAPEVGHLLGAIKDANSAVHDGFRAFKEGNAPFLVVRLQGNASESLHRLFLNALLLALSEAEPYIGKVTLPFWFTEAAAFVGKLSGERLDTANAFLASKGFDVPALLAALRNSDASVYELCRDLSYHLNGVRGDFGSEVSLNDAVKWATETFCGTDKPLRGMLVLFDEFVVFVERYAEKRGGSNTGALQQLLDGVANARGKACFVAFAQTDPDDALKRFFAREGANESGAADITKELTRLPKDSRFLLHSSLERVMNAFLSPDKDRWSTIASTVETPLLDATDITIQLLPSRYDTKVGWGTEAVYDILTTGCFPLHPLTTGLLCTLQMTQGTVTRSVLGAIRNALGELKDEPAVIENRPNWVYPAKLVDWFDDMLSDPTTFDAYKRAMQSVGGDASMVETDILKAILLQITANLVPPSHAPGGFARLVRHLSGHPEDACAATLQNLSDRYLIEKDPVKELYRFPQGGDGEQARRFLKAVEHRASSIVLQFSGINDELHRTGRLVHQPVESLAAANPMDYAAKEWLFTRKSFTVDKLRDQVGKPFIYSTNVLQKGERGGIVFLLAQNDDDITYFNSEAERILNEAFPATNGVCLPIVVGLPIKPHPKFLPRLRKEKALDDLGSETREYGTAAVTKVRGTLKAELDAEMKSVRENVQWIVPAVFAAQVNNEAAKNDWRIKLECCYRMAYADMPPAFKKQYSVTTSSLRKAVHMIAERLALGRLKKDLDAVKNTNAIARDIITDYLVSNGQPGSWTLLDTFGAAQIPSKERLKKAWQHLDDAFAPGVATPLRDVLLPLMRPPFGYDWNHLTLVFCAWVGYYGSRLQWEEKGNLKRVGDYVGWLSRSDTFITGLCDANVHLKMIDEQSEGRRIAELIAKLRQKRCTATEARNYRVELNSFAQNIAMDEEARSKAAKMAQDLSDALNLAESYEHEANAILRKLTTSAGIGEQIADLERIEKDTLPKPTFVSIGENVATVEMLRTAVRTRVIGLIEGELSQNSVLKSEEKYESQRTALSMVKKYAERIGELSLIAKINAAIADIGEKHKELQADRNDKQLIGELQRFAPSSASIVQLTQFQEWLKAIAPCGERAKDIAESRRGDIQKALDSASEFLASFGARIDTLSTHQQVLDERRRLDQRSLRYEGSDQEEVFRSLDQRLTALDVAFQLLQKTPLRTLKTPEEFNEREAELTEALVTNASAFSSLQRDRFRKELTDLRERREGEIEKAEQWISRHEEREPRDISVLENPPPFLNDDGRVRLARVRESLQERIQRKVDKDETEEILIRFVKLSPAKQADCLIRLQKQLIHAKRSGA